MLPFAEKAQVFKALADPTRLEIIDMLSCQECSTNRMLEQLSITQPTLCHHMKVLTGTGLVASRREGRMMYYRLSPERIGEFADFLSTVLSCPPGCPYQNAKCVIATEENNRRSTNMKNEIKLKIEGMHCGGCAMGLEAALEELPQVTSAAVSYPEKTAVVEYEAEAPAMAELRRVVEATGFSVVE